MAPMLDLFHQNRLSASELTGIYLLHILSHRYPKLWLGARRPSMNITHKMYTPLSDLNLELETNIIKRLDGVLNLGDMLNNFALKSTPETVNRSLLHWSNSNYGLELMFRIPSSSEVLSQQKMGRRCVTVLTEAEKIRTYILGERDSLSFTMHDLIHADHFYFHPESFDGQINFYWFIDFCMKKGHFDELMLVPKFVEELNYLISDMNAYAIHLMKCLKAALVFHHPEGESFFEKWVNQVSSTLSEKEALLRLNSKAYIPESEDAILLSLLAKFKV